MCTTWRTSRPSSPREPRMMWMTSLCPRVVTSPTLAPRFCTIAFVPTVVPWETSAVSASNVRHRLPALAGGGFERVHEAFGEVPRRRGGLGAHHAPAIVDDHAVGERPSDVEAAQVCGHGLRYGGSVTLSTAGASCFPSKLAWRNRERMTFDSRFGRTGSTRNPPSRSRSDGFERGLRDLRHSHHPSVPAIWRSGPTRRMATSCSATITTIGERSSPPIGGTIRAPDASSGSFRL